MNSKQAIQFWQKIIFLVMYVFYALKLFAILLAFSSWLWLDFQLQHLSHICCQELLCDFYQGSYAKLIVLEFDIIHLDTVNHDEYCEVSGKHWKFLHEKLVFVSE